ncbi:MAG: ankyrin [Nitrospirae bacterium]|nr:ankyrin [Nitrospirota bacterium]
MVMLENEIVCPECKGKKTIEGDSVCNMEWRGNKPDDELNDCITEPEKECPTCHGRGYIRQVA